MVITDRRVLDRQLQTTMRQFEQTLGVVENIEKTSRQLKEALESGKTIIVATLQKFPVIEKQALIPRTSPWASVIIIRECSDGPLAAMSERRFRKMLSHLQQSVRVLSACILVTIFAVPPSLLAQTHVVSPADLQKEMLDASRARQRNLESVRQFLSSPRAEKALKSAHMDPAHVKTAVSTLSDQELAQLASRADKAQADFAAGRLSDRDLIIILVGIAALILIIVAVR